jgi:hypothetical protein
MSKNQKPAARPYMRLGGAELVTLIEAGDKVAIAEASHRSNKAVRAAVAAVKPVKAARKAGPKAAAKPVIHLVLPTVEELVKAQANDAFDAAFAAAPAGEKRRAGGRAYRAVLEAAAAKAA